MTRSYKMIDWNFEYIYRMVLIDNQDYDQEVITKIAEYNQFQIKKSNSCTVSQ